MPHNAKSSPSAGPIDLLAVVRHPVGGIRTYLRYVYGKLPAGKYHFTILTVKTPETHLIREDLRSQSVSLVEAGEENDLVPLLKALFHRLQSRPRLVHSHGFTAGALTSIANAPFRIPHVMTSHDVFRPAQFASWTGPLKARALSMLLGQADLLQSVTMDAERNMFEYLPGLSRRTASKVILHGIEVDRFSNGDASTRNEWRESLGLPDGTFVFGFLGRIMPQKGFEYLVEAVQQQVQNGRRDFIVAVVSEGGYIREQRAHVEALGLSPYFRFTGFVADVAPVLAGLNAVVIPSLWEACCLLGMECLVAGCPVIGADCVGLREVLQGTPALVVPPADGAALGRAMIQMRDEFAGLKKQATGYAPEAAARFDSRRVAQELDACFDRLLAS